MQKMLEGLSYVSTVYSFGGTQRKCGQKRKEWKNRKKSIIKCKAKLYETYELLSKRILHKLYTPKRSDREEEQQRKIGKEQAAKSEE